MSSPRHLKSLDGVSSTGNGDEIRANGHYHLTVFVAAANFDGANDTLTVTVEGSPDGSRWDTIADDQGNDLSFDASDFAQDDDSGEHTLSDTHRGCYYEFYRLRVTGFSDNSGGDLTVDGYVMVAGNAGQGQRGQPDGP